MNVLVLNVGSSSVKFELIETSLEAIENDTEAKICRGGMDNIGMTASNVRLSVKGKPDYINSEQLHDHAAAISHMVHLLRSEAARSANPPKIDAVGHRIVHGG